MELEYWQGEQRLLGEVALPDPAKFGPGPYPGVVAIHEAWGLGDHIKTRIRMLADLGYVAMAADIFGDRHIPKDPPEGMAIITDFLNDREKLRLRAGAAVTALRNHEKCDGRIAAIGFCFGGSTVIELARWGNPDVLGVVSFHGGLSGEPGPIGPNGITAKMLILSGAEDPLVPHQDMMNFLNEMRDNNADCQTILYTGAVHSFTVPEARGQIMPGIHYHEPSDRRSWAALKSFLADDVFA